MSGKDTADAIEYDVQVQEVLDLFLNEIRERRYPSVKRLVATHPHIADCIRALIPSLVALEKLGDSLEDLEIPDHTNEIPAAGQQAQASIPVETPSTRRAAP